MLCTYSKLANRREDMLTKAAKDARIRTEAIAHKAGSEVGGLKRVNTGVFQINYSEFNEGKQLGFSWHFNYQERHHCGYGSNFCG